jgi:hypothetical protein
MDWIHLTWIGIVNTAINNWVPQISENLFTSWVIIIFWRIPCFLKLVKLYFIFWGRDTDFFVQISRISRRGYNLLYCPLSADFLLVLFFDPEN